MAVVSPGQPRSISRRPGGLEENGLGLVLVDSLADKWGVRETAAGKAVWAELDTRPDGEPV